MLDLDPMHSFKRLGSSDSQSSVVNVILDLVGGLEIDCCFFVDLLLLALLPFCLEDDDNDGGEEVVREALASRFVRNNRCTYSWSVAM